MSVAAAALMVLLARRVDVNPLDRIGQVSGLAALQLRYALIAVVVLALAVITARTRWAAHAPLIRRLGAATTAGLFGGLVAGAVVIALRGTSWGLFASYGDVGVITSWVHKLIDTGAMQDNYPPGWPHVLAWYSQLTDTPPEYAQKTLGIVFTALYGPIAYLSWRLLLSPMWALGLGVVPAMALIDPYKPYTNIMLVVMVPVMIALLRRLRRSPEAPWRSLVLQGVAFGLGLGVVFLVYSGWFVWSAPGVIVAALVLFPWRRGWKQGLVLVGVTAAVFFAVSFRHVLGLLRASQGSGDDSFFYLDTWIEPTYIAMWKNDLPGETGPWPPLGELGGVGLFTVLAIAGMAAAIALGRKHTVVITLTSMFAGAWLLRFWFSSQMYATNTVQLYPRSSAELLYCLLLLAGFAVFYGVRRFDGVAAVRERLASPSPAIGALAALMLLIASAGSATGDRYMPRTDNSLGSLATAAQLARQLDGRCSAYAATLNRGCFEQKDMTFFAVMGELVDVGPRRGELPHQQPGG
ncbi:hypothetical protein [Saccharothrix sp. HUAS TT1]|uniref:hypothetical protein n=1 Tax=unclassified Saccharothrix TaxID=2593673 RepID=UPI00345C5E6C